MTKPIGIPELAGVATYAQAARVGYSVEENVQRLLRIHWTARRLMQTMWAHLASTPVWEVKCALALDQWYCAEHCDWLRRRVKEMRHPTPPLDQPPNSELDAFLEEVLRAQNPPELVAGIYGVAFPALREAYFNHIQHSNPLVDHPPQRLMRTALHEVSEANACSENAPAELTQDETVASSEA